VLLLYCDNLTDLYRRMLISYLCNCRVYITQVRRLIQRIRCTHMALMLSFSFGGLQLSKLFALSFWLVWVIQHQVSWLLEQRVNGICISCSVRLTCRPVLHHAANETRSSGLWDKTVSSSNRESSRRSGASLISFACVTSNYLIKTINWSLRKLQYIVIVTHSLLQSNEAGFTRLTFLKITFSLVFYLQLD
jgi:hypothetical protein